MHNLEMVRQIVFIGQFSFLLSAVIIINVCSQTNKDLAKKITEEVKNKCLKKTNVELFELDDEPLVAFGIMDEIKKQIDMLLKTMKCAKMVIGEEVDGTDFKQDYEEFKAIVDNIFKHDTKKCGEMKSLKEKFM